MIEDKRKGKAQRASNHRSPQKTHATGELVIVAENGGHTMHCLASSLATVVRLAGRQAGRPKKRVWMI